MNNVYKEIKEEQKSLGNEIKNLKEVRSTSFRTLNFENACKFQIRILKFQKTFRHKHIARCELMGRTREQIETPSKNNLPNETLITQYKQEYVKRIEEYEALRADETGSKFIADSGAVWSFNR